MQVYLCLMSRWCLLLLFIPFFAQAQVPLVLSRVDEQHLISPVLTNDTNGNLSLEQVKQAEFQPLTGNYKNTAVQWVKFMIKTPEKKDFLCKISINFTDNIQLFVPDGKGGFLQKVTGDLVPVSLREVPAGQMVFAEIPVYAGQLNSYYIRIESRSRISMQFRNFTLNSLKLYSEPYFQKLFVNSRVYLAFFYGAILIIWLYNLFLYLSLRDKNIFYYLLFLLSLLVFLSSNSGFLAEIFLDAFPKTDLYIRFLSTPLMLLLYVLFTKSYLRLSENMPALSRLTTYILLWLVGIMLVMLAGFWAMGRSLVIFTAIFTFLFVGGVSLVSFRKGFAPARYFIIANAVFLISGIIFSVQRMGVPLNNFVSLYHPLIGIVLQVSFFSLGLAESIRLARQELLEKSLENERLERQKEAELKKITDEKNEALQKVVDELDMYIYKTAHDIRGPLARLMGLTHVALLDVTDPTALNFINKLNTEALNLNYILARLSKVYDIKHSTLRKEHIALLPFVEQIVNEEKQKIPDAASLQIDLTGDASLQILSDRKLLDCILRNLIENAIRFRKNKPGDFIKIDFSLHKLLIYIQITDNGTGIPPEFRETIFEMFTKAAGLYKTAGLGLYITRLATEKLGGTIRLMPHPEELTQFVVEL